MEVGDSLLDQRKLAKPKYIKKSINKADVTIRLTHVDIDNHYNIYISNYGQ